MKEGRGRGAKWSNYVGVTYSLRGINDARARARAICDAIG